VVADPDGSGVGLVGEIVICPVSGAVALAGVVTATTVPNPRAITAVATAMLRQRVSPLPFSTPSHTFRATASLELGLPRSTLNRDWPRSTDRTRQHEP